MLEGDFKDFSNIFKPLLDKNNFVLENFPCN